MSNRTGSAAPSPWLIALLLLTVTASGIAGFFAARLGGDRGATEAIVRDYILEHPEILPEAMERLQRKQGAQQLSGIRDEVMTPFPGAILGNPEGTVTLVEFSDFACGFCRRSVDDIDALLAQHPDLRIVVHELPILSEESNAAARMALAAAEQGKYREFFHAMFAAGRPGPGTIAAAARSAGLDMDKARAALTSPRVERAIARNLEMAQQLGFNGTPSWIAGDQLISGAVGAEQLSDAVETARKQG